MADESSGNGKGAKPTKNPASSEEKKNDPDSVTETEHKSSEAVVSVKQCVKTGKDQEKAPKRHRDSYDWWVFALLVGATIAAVAAAIFAYDAADATWAQAARQREHMITAERAWLAPYDLENTGDFQLGVEREINLLFRNTGNTPALNSNLLYDPLLIPVQELRKTNLVRAYIRQKIGGKDCKSVDPKPNGYAIFPSGESNERARVLIRPPLIEKILARSHYLAVVGCFAYESFDKSRHTEFCFFFDFGITKRGATSKDWIATRCPNVPTYTD